jgi:hypothetical protein
MDSSTMGSRELASAGVMARRLSRLIATGGIVAATVLAPSAAFGQAYGGGDNNTDSGGGDPGGSSSTGTNGGDSGDTLPFTGGDVLQFTLIGVGALAGGTALVRAGKRRVVAEI